MRQHLLLLAVTLCSATLLENQAIAQQEPVVLMPSTWQSVSPRTVVRFQEATEPADVPPSLSGSGAAAAAAPLPATIPGAPVSSGGYCSPPYAAPGYSVPAYGYGAGRSAPVVRSYSVPAYGGYPPANPPYGYGYPRTVYPSGPVTVFRPLVPVLPAPGQVQVGRGILGQPTVYVPGQPLRNFLRYISP